MPAGPRRAFENPEKDRARINTTQWVIIQKPLRLQLIRAIPE